MLVLGSIGFLGGGTLGEHGSSVLVQLELGDDTVGWVNTNLDGGSVHFLALHSFDVDDEFSSVNIDDLTGLLAFEVTTDNHDLDIYIRHTVTTVNSKYYKSVTNVTKTYFVILSDWKRSDVVLSSQFLGEWSRHDL